MKKTAVLTQVKDESKLLPIWLRYYTKHFDNVYVSRHGGERDYILKEQKKYNFKVLEIENEEDYPHQEMVDRVAEIINTELISKYDVILYADIDEFVIPDPEKYKDLREYMQTVEDKWVICTGREVLEVKSERNVRIDWNRPVLSQREYWWAHPAEWKPAITTIPIEKYAPGFHYTSDMEKEWHELGMNMKEYIEEKADPHLFMVHINQIDSHLHSNRGRRRNFGHGMDDKSKELIPNKFKKLL